MEVTVLKMSRTEHNVKLPIMDYTDGPAEGYHNFSLPLDAVSCLKSTGKYTRIITIYHNDHFFYQNPPFCPMITCLPNSKE